MTHEKSWHGTNHTGLLTAWNNTQYGTGKSTGDRKQNGTWHSVAQEKSFENVYIEGQNIVHKIQSLAKNFGQNRT